MTVGAARRRRVLRGRVGGQVRAYPATLVYLAVCVAGLLLVAVVFG